MHVEPYTRYVGGHTFDREQDLHSSFGINGNAWETIINENFVFPFVIIASISEIKA